MATVPLVTGCPPAVTAIVKGSEHPLNVPAVSVVEVATATGAASAGINSAIPDPAINPSRKARRIKPLTSTCSQNQNRLPPVCRSPNLIVSGGSGPKPFQRPSLDAISVRKALVSRLKVFCTSFPLQSAQ
jgi:hypothetical protein